MVRNTHNLPEQDASSCIHYVPRRAIEHADQILVDQMFRDRAAQFRDRMRWDVHVDDRGWEMDQYDTTELNPLYIIHERADGSHGGSGRLMSTADRTMIAEHFSGIAGGQSLDSPAIWEITRLCISPRVTSRAEAMEVTSSLLLAGIDFGLLNGITEFVGVFDAPMIRVYRGLDFVPRVLGRTSDDPRAICAGVWPCTPEVRDAMSTRVQAYRQQRIEAAQTTRKRA